MYRKRLKTLKIGLKNAFSETCSRAGGQTHAGKIVSVNVELFKQIVIGEYLFRNGAYQTLTEQFSLFSARHAVNFAELFVCVQHLCNYAVDLLHFFDKSVFFDKIKEFVFVHAVKSCLVIDFFGKCFAS